MDQFNYLVALVGVIIGLAIAQVLSGLVDYIQNRHRVRWYWVQVVWMLILFLLQVQYWYTLFGTEEIGVNFGRYVGSLVFPTLMYLASGVLVPKVPDQGRLDLEARYYTNQRWFFALCLAGMLVLSCQEQIVFGKPWSELWSSMSSVGAYRLVGALLLLVLLAVINEWVHALVTLLILAAVGLFIAKHNLGW
jgi:hypothetical protein